MHPEDRPAPRYLRVGRSLAGALSQPRTALAARAVAFAALALPLASLLAGCPGPLPPPEAPRG